MPVYQIDPEAGPFVVVQAKDGTFAVAEIAAIEGEEASAKMGFVFIPCRDETQAEAVCDELNRGEHGGHVQVDLFEASGEDSR